MPAHCRVSGRHEPQTQRSCFNARSALLCLPPTLCSPCGVLSPQHLAECTLTMGANICGAMRVAKPQCGVGENRWQGGMAGQRRRGPGGLRLLQTAGGGLPPRLQTRSINFQSTRPGRKKLNTQGSVRAKPEPGAWGGHTWGTLGPWMVVWGGGGQHRGGERKGVPQPLWGTATLVWPAISLAPLRLKPRQALPVDPSVTSCFESGSPGLTILLANFSLTRELAISKLLLWGAPMTSFLRF